MTLKKTSSLLSLMAIGMISVAGCQSNDTGHVPLEYFSGTTLDRNAIQVVEKKRYLEVNMDARDQQLRLTEIAKIKDFLADYNESGHGPLVISLPKYAENEELAVTAAVEARQLAWEAGIEYSQIMGAAYDARGRATTPLLMAFKSFEAKAPDCPSLSEIDFTNAISNSDLPTLGCAVRTNMAAMIAEPADLFGDRELSEGDLIRRERQLALWRDGQATASQRGDGESGAISAAVN